MRLTKPIIELLQTNPLIASIRDENGFVLRWRAIFPLSSC